MDTVIANKYSDILSTLNIEVSKKLEGIYEVDEIISTFGNYFFNKMFLDITAIKDYKDLNNLQKLSMSINMDKVILLLDKDDSISDSSVFLSKLVSMGIYNFTKNSNDLMYLYTNPNIYRDVAHYQDIDSKVEDSPNASLKESSIRKVLGVKNITDSAGSTTLVYLLKKVLSDYYSTIAIEINKKDLTYFHDKDCLSVKEEDIESTMDKYSSISTFIIDLDRTNKDHICTEVLYLIEPSTIKLNKLSLINPKIFSELKGKNIVLNKSLLNDSDIANFEVESDLKVYYNIPPLNDKEDASKYLLPLLEKLGYIKAVEQEEKEETPKRGIFDIFKKK